MDNDYFYYCDRCGCPIDNQLNPKNATYNFCPNCTLELYRKIFGKKQEGDEQ